MIRSIINQIFFRWSKWELFKENAPYKKYQENHITGWRSEPVDVIVDIYVKTNLYNGLKKYKKVIKT